jgi:hypothetical protein
MNLHLSIDLVGLALVLVLATTVSGWWLLAIPLMILRPTTYIIYDGERGWLPDREKK